MTYEKQGFRVYDKDHYIHTAIEWLNSCESKAEFRNNRAIVIQAVAEYLANRDGISIYGKVTNGSRKD